MKSIVIFTSNRSEWGILKSLAIELNKRYDLRIVACASHLSVVYNTITDINGFKCEKVENSLSSDTREGCCKSSGILLITLPDILRRIDPEFVIILGDRYESFAAASVCCIMNIKILHLHGGEESGNIDNIFRDCITQMSYVHCTSTKNAEDILIHNFNCTNVFMTGALGCDGLQRSNNRNKNSLMVIYHPITNDEIEDFNEILSALEIFCYGKGYYIDFILANNDFGGCEINKMIKDFCTVSDLNTIINVHLERNKFIDLLSNSACIIGNSSCGIIEAPVLGIPTINIGTRQIWRQRASSIIDCNCDRDDIINELKLLENNNFEYDFSYIPYQGKDVVKKIINVIEEVF